MSDVTIITHFTNPNWPFVNKLSAIARCLEVNRVHCSSLEKLTKALADHVKGRVLFFTDEGMIDFVQQVGSQRKNDNLEVAMLIDSPLSSVAKKISNLEVVKYLIGAQPVEAFGRDLSILIKKFADGDFLDLDKYLAFGSRIHKRLVNSAESRREAIEAVGKYISALGDPGYAHPFDEYSRRICELTDELLLNAVFSANPRLRQADRSKPFQLSPEEEIRMSWGYDGEYFGISVCDPFGKFPFETIMNYVSSQRRIDQLAPNESGGIGLKFIFEKAHSVITNVKNEKVTEVIALVRFGNRILEFEKQKKSFYYFGDNDSRKKIG